MKKRLLLFALLAIYVCCAAVTSPAQQTSPDNKTKEIVFGEFKPYTHSTRRFSMSIPSNWSINEKETDTEVIVSIADPTENAVFVTRVWKSDSPMTQAEKADAVKGYLDGAMGKFPKYSRNEPKTQADGGLSIFFTYDSIVKDKTYPMSGYTSIVDKGNLVGFVSLIMPTDQHDRKIESARKLLDSFRLDPGPAR